VPGHFTTLWKSQSASTPSGQLAQGAAEYYYSARAESVKSVLKSKLENITQNEEYHSNGIATLCDTYGRCNAICQVFGHMTMLFVIQNLYRFQ
jgi:hypothetical protein